MNRKILFYIKNHTKWSSMLVLSIIGFLLPGLAVTAHADNGITKRVVIGSSTIGWNRDFTSPIAELPGGIGMFSFRTIGQYNPGGDVIPITTELPASTMVATFLDPEWVTTLGFPLEVLDIAKTNIPLRDVPIRIDAGGFNKSSLSELADLEQMDFGLVSPAYPITLGDWYRARGEFEFTCYNGKYSKVKSKFSGLIPNHIYTLREWFIPQPSTEFIVVPGVFGGAPASFMADKYGNGDYAFKMPGCPPMSAEETGHPLVAIAVTVSFAHESGGMVPVTPLHPTDPTFPGERAYGQLFFPLTGDRLVPGAGGISDIHHWACKEVSVAESVLFMTSPSSPTTGQADVMIGHEVRTADTNITFVRPPELQDDGSLKFLATLRFDFDNGEILDGLIEGKFIPTENETIVEIMSKARFVGGEGAFKTAIGDFMISGSANFATLNVDLSGHGKVCSPGNQG